LICLILAERTWSSNLTKSVKTLFSGLRTHCSCFLKCSLSCFHICMHTYTYSSFYQNISTFRPTLCTWYVLCRYMHVAFCCIERCRNTQGCWHLTVGDNPNTHSSIAYCFYNFNIRYCCASGLCRGYCHCGAVEVYLCIFLLNLSSFELYFPFLFIFDQIIFKYILRYYFSLWFMYLCVCKLFYSSLVHRYYGLQLF